MTQSDWISVEERLPEDGDEILVSGYRYNNKINGRFIMVGQYNKTLNRFIDNSDEEETTIHAPTHWMPLPELPGDDHE